MEVIWRVLKESRQPTIEAMEQICTKIKSYLICPDGRLVGYRDMGKRGWHMVGVYIFEPELIFLNLNIKIISGALQHASTWIQGWGEHWPLWGEE